MKPDQQETWTAPHPGSRIGRKQWPISIEGKESNQEAWVLSLTPQGQQTRRKDMDTSQVHPPDTGIWDAEAEMNWLSFGVAWWS